MTLDEQHRTFRPRYLSLDQVQRLFLLTLLRYQKIASVNGYRDLLLPSIELQLYAAMLVCRHVQTGTQPRGPY